MYGPIVKKKVIVYKVTRFLSHYVAITPANNPGGTHGYLQVLPYIPNTFLI